MTVYVEGMNPPIEKGARVVLNGNLQPYAVAYVTETIYLPQRQAWAILLEWPNVPGGPGYSRIYSDEEGKGWYRYVASN